MDQVPTRRQLEVMSRVATGATRAEVASEMFISVETVQQHLRNLRDILGARTVTQAMVICICRGYLAADGRREVIFVPEPFDEPPPFPAELQMAA